MKLTSRDISFNEKTHRYWITDTKPKQYIPSVTTIAGLLNKPFLVEWSAKEAAAMALEMAASYDGDWNDEDCEVFVKQVQGAHRRKNKEGQAVGSYVHAYAAMQLDPQAPYPDQIDSLEADLAADAWTAWHQEWIVDRGYKPLYVEQKVVHPSGDYVGTFDLLMQGEGRTVLVDYKTSNKSKSNPKALYPENVMQASAYRRAILDSSEFDVTVDAAQIVSCGKDGELKLTEFGVGELDDAFVAFRCLADLYPNIRAVEALIRKKNKEG